MWTLQLHELSVVFLLLSSAVFCIQQDGVKLFDEAKPHTTPNSWEDARVLCQSAQARLPRLVEVKEFFRQVLPDTSADMNASYTFYVNEKVEALPNNLATSDESVCIVVMKGPRNSLHIVPSSTAQSCRVRTNFQVCRYENNTFEMLKKGICEKATEGNLCMRQHYFYAINAGILVILLILAFLLIVYMCKSYRARLRLARLIRERHEILNDEWSATGLPLPLGTLTGSNSHPLQHHHQNYLNPWRTNPVFGGSSRVSRHDSCLIPPTGHTTSQTPRLQGFSSNQSAMRTLADYHNKLTNDSFLNHSSTLVKQSNQASGFL